MNQRVIDLANRANRDIGYKFKLEDAKQLHELMENFFHLVVDECAYTARQCYTVRAVDAEDVATHIKETLGTK
jgi:hypothetical protein